MGKWQIICMAGSSFNVQLEGKKCSGDYEEAKQQKEFSNSILKAWRGWLDSI